MFRNIRSDDGYTFIMEILYLMISVKRQERCTNDDELNDNEKKARCKK